MQPPARTIVALDMRKAFDTVHIHTLIGKLLQTNIPPTIIKLIANFINGRKAYTRFRNHTSTAHRLKIGVPQGGVLSPILFNLHVYTSDIPQSQVHKLFHISFGTQSFSSVSTKIWNAFMAQIDSNVPLVKFKQSLKLYLLNNTLVISYSK